MTKKATKAAEKTHPIHEAIHEIMKDGGESIGLADGFAEALIGLSLSSPGRPALTVYDYEKCARILVHRDKMSYEEACEFLDSNIVGVWVGADTPVFINKLKTMLEQNGMEAVLKKPKIPKVDPRQLSLI
jgi:hypothetical protein